MCQLTHCAFRERTSAHLSHQQSPSAQAAPAQLGVAAPHSDSDVPGHVRDFLSSSRLNFQKFPCSTASFRWILQRPTHHHSLCLLPSPSLRTSGHFRHSRTLQNYTYERNLERHEHTDALVYLRVFR